MYRALLAQSGFSMERLASFCELAELGSFAKASKGDPNTASLMSRQIRELESFFGTNLVRRVGRGLELTEAGRELAAIGRENFKGLADYAARCRQQPWSVRIVASNSIAQWFLLPRLKAVSEAQPKVHFEIHHEQTRDMVAGTREGTYDLALVRKDALVPGLKHAVLGGIASCLFIPKALAKEPPKSAAEALSVLPMALPIGGRMKSTLERLAATKGGVPRVTVACSSYLQAAQAVQSGMCAAVLPETAAANLDVRNLHRLPIPGKFTLCLAWTARNADTRPALIRLIDVMVDHLRLPEEAAPRKPHRPATRSHRPAPAG